MGSKVGIKRGPQSTPNRSNTIKTELQEASKGCHAAEVGRRDERSHLRCACLLGFDANRAASATASGRAELVAVLRAIQHSERSGVIWSDYQLLLDGISRGPKWTTRAASNSADAWKQIWWKLADFADCPRGGWDFKKVKAHVQVLAVLKTLHFGVSFNAFTFYFQMDKGTIRRAFHAFCNAISSDDELL